jgi:hypothetical protein
MAWLARYERFTLHFTPTSCSWLDAVESFFAKLAKQRLKRQGAPDRRTKKMPLRIRRSFTPGNPTRLLGQHRLDGGPFTVREFIAHDFALQFGSLNHRHRS